MFVYKSGMNDANRCQLRSDVGFQMLAHNTKNVISTPNTIVFEPNVKMTIAGGETQFECVRLIVSVVIVGLKQSMWNIALLSSNLAVQYPNLVRPSWIVVSRVASTQPICLGQSS